MSNIQDQLQQELNALAKSTIYNNGSTTSTEKSKNDFKSFIEQKSNEFTDNFIRLLAEYSPYCSIPYVYILTLINNKRGVQTSPEQTLLDYILNYSNLKGAFFKNLELTKMQDNEVSNMAIMGKNINNQ